MAYNRTKWQDHVVERPRTFTEVTNADGSVTHTPAPGEVPAAGYASERDQLQQH